VYKVPRPALGVSSPYRTELYIASILFYECSFLPPREAAVRSTRHENFHLKQEKDQNVRNR
jgi:hypothetical protein